MYYEERMINDVLHFRNWPKGDWIPRSPKEITDELVSLRRENQLLRDELDAATKDKAME